MRRDEFAIVDQVRRQDMDMLVTMLECYQATTTNEDVAWGLERSIKLIKAYKTHIGENTNEPNESISDH